MIKNTLSSAALLQQIPLFAGLDEKQLQCLAQCCRRRQFQAQATLFYEGDPGHALYILISGHVSVQTTTPSGERLHLAERGPGDHFGEMSLLDGKPRMADVVTEEPCDVLMLDRMEFAHCIESSPQLALAVMVALSNRLREAAGQLQKREGLDVVGRVSEALLELMQKQGVEETGIGKRLRVRVSQQDLALRIGATRESVNRALSGLKATKCICMEGRQIIILNERRLKQNSSL